jgi:dienelactone hydrolase
MDAGTARSGSAATPGPDPSAPDAATAPLSGDNDAAVEDVSSDGGTSNKPVQDAGPARLRDGGAPDASVRDGGARDAGLGGVPSRSAGCGKPATGSSSFQMRTLRVGDRDRVYFVRVPSSYDRNRAYPLYFGFHNSGGDGAMGGVDLAEFAGDDAILVSPTAIEPNRTFPEQLPAELALFDALRERMNNDYCLDRAQLYSVGMSAGAEMTNFLSCKRGDLLRATGALSGRISPGNEDDILGSCVATPATFLFHAVDDDVAPVAASRTIVAARIKALGCDGESAFDKSGDCRAYRGCREPLTYCEPAKGGHGGGLTRDYRERLWKFIAGL